ncbi:hypothetical protein BH10CHL1_BH10CHL1_32700 [soil metagenome]
MSSKSSKQRLTRREFLRTSAVTTAGLVVIACAPPASAPQTAGGNAAPAQGKPK